MRKSVFPVILVMFLLACRSSDLLALRAGPPTATPTFVLARFTTPTFTPIPSNTPIVEPTNTAVPTSELPEPSPSPTNEATPIEKSDTTFESPISTPIPEDTPTPVETPTATSPPPPPTAIPTETPSPTPAPLSGRIAFSIDDGAGFYDIWVVELPDGEPFMILPRARQPNFSKDGRLLVNNHGSQYGESLGLLDASYTWQGIINDSPDDAYPFWHPDGSRYVYSNPGLLLEPVTNNPLPHAFIPCSMQMPAFEQNEKCKDIRTFGKVSIGESPVWTDDDRIALFSFEGDDGIYVVSNASALWVAGGVGAKKLLITGNGRPSDTQGFQVFFSAGNIDGNWEAYAIDLDGNNLTNLSNSPDSQDGLPTISPDGNWVAFVSDRDGKWGIWVVPRTGGEPKKIVDLSTLNTPGIPWGVDDRAWTTERITWGP